MCEPDVITGAEEAALLGEIRRLEFHAVPMHGAVARRRVIQYGCKYGLDRSRLAWQHSIPEVNELRYSITFRTLRR